MQFGSALLIIFKVNCGNGQTDDHPTERSYCKRCTKRALLIRTTRGTKITQKSGRHLQIIGERKVIRSSTLRTHNYAVVAFQPHC